MNHKQKLGYMALGAGILAVGIMVGQFITPDIEAQNNEVFDEIKCREIRVVDEDGYLGISLSAQKGVSRIGIHNQGSDAHILLYAIDTASGIILTDAASEDAISLSAGEGRNRVRVHDKAGNMAMLLISNEDANSITVWGKDEKPAILLSAFETENHVFVFDKARHGAVKLMGNRDRTAVYVGDGEQAGQISLIADEAGNLIRLNGKAGEESINLIAGDKTSPSMFITDRAGKTTWGSR